MYNSILSGVQGRGWWWICFGIFL